MGKCCSRFWSVETHGDRDDPLVDVETLLTKHAKNQVLYLNKLQKHNFKKNYNCEVDWSTINIRNKVTLFNPRPTMSSDNQNDTEQKLSLFTTEYVNSSGKEQEFNFRAERETKSHCEMSIQKGFRIKGQVDFPFCIPNDKVSGLSGRLAGEFQVEKRHGTAFTETLKWSVDNKITAPEHKKTIASMNVLESHLHADFHMETLFQPLEHFVKLFVREKKTNRLARIVYIPKDTFAEVFADYVSKKTFRQVDMESETEEFKKLFPGEKFDPGPWPIDPSQGPVKRENEKQGPSKSDKGGSDKKDEEEKPSSSKSDTSGSNKDSEKSSLLESNKGRDMFPMQRKKGGEVKVQEPTPSDATGLSSSDPKPGTSKNENETYKRPDAIVCVTKGICSAVYGARQIISVKYEPLSKDDETLHSTEDHANEEEGQEQVGNGKEMQQQVRNQGEAQDERNKETLPESIQGNDELQGKDWTDISAKDVLS